MGRTALAIGTYGDIGYVQKPNGLIQARARFRDYDGRTRLVGRTGKSETAARTALKKAFAERQPPTGGDLSADSTVADLAERWLTMPHDWSSGTQRIYRGMVKNEVLPALGGLKIREATPGRIADALEAIIAHHGPSAAKSTKACLSGMFYLAVRHGAAPTNPVRDTSVSTTKRPKRVKALSREQVTDLTDWLRVEGSRSAALDFPDLVDFMLGTGCRIGEALACRYELNEDGKQVLDLEVGTWEVNATVVRVLGVQRLKDLEAKSHLTVTEQDELRALRTLPPGLHIQRRTKTDAGWRVVALPTYVVAMLRRRATETHRLRGPDNVVFPAPLAKSLRDPSNTLGDLRVLLDGLHCAHCRGTGYKLVDPDAETPVRALNARKRPIRCDLGPWSWVTTHKFRKTVATRMEESGCTPREVADQLGHAQPSMTMNVYFGRGVASAKAAEVLDR